MPGTARDFSSTITGGTFTLPVSIWLLTGFFKALPKELEDAALVDGLTRFQAFVRVMIPMSGPGIVSVVMVTFTLVTQEFFCALTFISSESQQMLAWASRRFSCAVTCTSGRR